MKFICRHPDCQKTKRFWIRPAVNYWWCDQHRCQVKKCPEPRFHTSPCCEIHISMYDREKILNPQGYQQMLTPRGGREMVSDVDLPTVYI